MTLVVKDGNLVNQNVATFTDANSEIQQKVAHDKGSSKTLVSGVINVSTSGDQTLVAAQGTGKIINLVSYTLVVNGAVTLQWKSGTNNKSGAMSFAANGGASPSGSVEAPVLWTNANEALILNLGTSVQVSGHYVYYVDTV